MFGRSPSRRRQPGGDVAASGAGGRRHVLRAGALLAMLGASIGIVYETVGSAQQAPGNQVPQTPQFSAQQIADCLASGQARVATHGRTGVVRLIGASGGEALQGQRAQPGLTPEAAVTRYLAACGSLFGLADPATELAVMRTAQLDRLRRVVRLQQRFRGVPILGAELVVHTDAASNILVVAGETLPGLSLSTVPTVDAGTAVTAAVDRVVERYGIDRSALNPGPPELWVYAPSLLGPQIGRTILVWRLDVLHDGIEPVRELVLVDAHQGSVALHFNQIETALNRSTYNAANTSALPGVLVCNETNPTCAGGDADAVAAHTYARDSYDYYASLGRDSLDNAGMPLTSTVHYGPIGYPNAFWNGVQVAYGDGFALSDDVVGHELTHGVTDFTSGLFYYYQSGAINESLSDVVGEFIDQLNGKGDDSAAVRWLLGEDLPGGAIRHMQDPTFSGQPDRMRSALYFTGAGDNGGVHYNSGINNKAAYLMVDGGTFNGQTVTAIGIAKAGRIYYEAQSLLTSGSDYADLHDALFQACAGLVGTGAIVSADCQQVRNATLAVEMHLEPSPGFNPDAPVCAPGQIPAAIFFDDIESGLSSFVTSSSVGPTRWSEVEWYAHSGLRSLYGHDSASGPGDSSIATASPITLPPGAFLHFAHSFGFHTPDRDGGVVEYSIDGGTTWLDAGSLFDANGYRGTIATGFSNPLAGRAAFIGTSHGYGSSRLNLSSLAGQSVRFRWRLGVDTSGFDLGWYLDDIRIYQCSGAQITGVTPPTGRQGRVGLNVSLTGSGTHFAQGVTTASFGAGIAVNSVTVTDATHAIVNITIASNAALGSRDISLTTGSELASALNAFTVAPAALLTFAPNRGQPGQSHLAVAITGTLTSFVEGQTTAAFGAGVTTLRVSVTDPTHAIAVVSIDAAAAHGPRTVTVTTGDEVVTAPGGFLVRPLASNPRVYVYAVGRRLSPSQGGTNGIQTLNVIDATTNAIVAAIPVGQGCHCVGPDGVAVHPDGTRVYVTNELENTVTVVDALSNTVVTTVPVGAGPSAVAVHPNGTRVYVVNGTNPTSVSVLDANANTVVATVPFGGQPVIQARGITISPDGSRVYVTTYGSGLVKVISTATNTVVATISTGNIGLGLDVAPNGTRLYVATFPFSGSGSTPYVSLIDTATNAVIGNIFDMPFLTSDVGVTPDGTRAYVVASSSTTVISTATNTQITSLAYPASHSAIDFTPDGARAYVANNNDVGIVNAQTNTVIGSVPSFTEAANGHPSAIAVGPGPLRTLSASGNLDFGYRWVGSRVSGVLALSNAGNAPLTVQSLTLPAGFTANWSGGTIAPLAAQLIEVSFEPTSAAGYGGVIAINDNHTSGPTSIAVSGTGIAAPFAATDFDNDGKADIGIYRRSNGLWALAQSAAGSRVLPWGDPGSWDMPVAADYDGDGKADIAVYRRTTGGWFILLSATGAPWVVNWGAPSAGDIPVPADYDGDGKADIAVFRRNSGEWFILKSSNHALLHVPWGAPALGDVPVPADYDGDGRADIGVHRLTTGEWFVSRSSNGSLLHVTWGSATFGDVPVVGDYDGDGKADVGVYRSRTGEWFVIRSSNGSLLAAQWGAPALGDLAVPGDYDGDGRTDVAVYRAATGEWFIVRSSNGSLLHAAWGAPGLGDSPHQYQ